MLPPSLRPRGIPTTHPGGGAARNDGGGGWWRLGFGSRPPPTRGTSDSIRVQYVLCFLSFLRFTFLHFKQSLKRRRKAI
jgi:hypothetical protein